MDTCVKVMWACKSATVALWFRPERTTTLQGAAVAYHMGKMAIDKAYGLKHLIYSPLCTGRCTEGNA